MSWIPNLVNRATDAHKGDFGRIGILAGSKGMLGAAIMSAKAAMRCGAGVVYLLTIESAATEINIALPELIVVPLPETDGAIGVSALPAIWNAKDNYHFSAMGIGPGMGRTADTQQLIREVIPMVGGVDCPIVLDAEGLFAHDSQRLAEYPKGSVVVTPHAGEFLKLFGSHPMDPETRLSQAESAADACKQIVVLKGAKSLVCSWGEDSYVNTTGNPGMATGGAGDVLMGMITAFCGQGYSAFESAKMGVYLHGLAGDMAAHGLGEHSVMATDIIDRISLAIQSLEPKS
ncbi:MAG: NAD(P)H-hydrate dehydratase [bacterium]|nr:NAD(P)H-hydrate dehydratase [bacterium]